jgi:hypothetical protein
MKRSMPKGKPSSKKVPDNQDGIRKPNGQWQLGVSGNVNGRPRGKLPSELIREMLQAEYGGHNIDQIRQLQQALPEPWKSKPPEKLTTMEILCAMHIIAGRRSLEAVMEREAVFNRVEGRPVQKIAGADGGPIQLEPVYNLKNLSTEELRLWRELQSKATRTNGDE